MVDVIKWPKVGEVAFEISKIDPISVSTSLIDGQPRFSRYGRSRRVARTSVSGIGPDAAGAGYMEMLKEFLEGGVNLTRVTTYSSIWHFVRASNNDRIENYKLNWTDNSNPLLWTDNSVDLHWWNNDLPVSPTTDNGWPALLVENLPPNIIVARPHENISISSVDGTQTQMTKVLRVTKSDAEGTALIRVRDSLTISGQAVIGATEDIVFRPLDLPRAVQPQLGNWKYDWSFVEAFEDEYPEGFLEVNPWD